VPRRMTKQRWRELVTDGAWACVCEMIWGDTSAIVPPLPEGSNYPNDGRKAVRWPGRPGRQARAFLPSCVVLLAISSLRSATQAAKCFFWLAVSPVLMISFGRSTRGTPAPADANAVSSIAGLDEGADVVGAYSSERG